MALVNDETEGPMNRVQTRLLTTLLAAAMAMTVGCVPQGGDADGDPGMNLEPQADAGVRGNNGNGGPRIGGDVEYPPGVSDADQVAEIDEGDLQAVCDALEATFVDALPEAELLAFTCAAQALFFGLLSEMNPEAGCQMAYDACVADPEGLMTEENDDPCPLVEQPECTATLAEIEACISDGLQAIVAFNDVFECALLNELEADPMAGMDEGSPACDALEAKCPGLLDDDDENSIDGPEGEADNTPR